MTQLNSEWDESSIYSWTGLFWTREPYYKNKWIFLKLIRKTLPEMHLDFCQHITWDIGSSLLKFQDYVELVLLYNILDLLSTRSTDHVFSPGSVKTWKSFFLVNCCLWIGFRQDNDSSLDPQTQKLPLNQGKKRKEYEEFQDHTLAMNW